VRSNLVFLAVSLFFVFLGPLKAESLVENHLKVRLREGDKAFVHAGAPEPSLWGTRLAEGWVDVSRQDALILRDDTGKQLKRIDYPAGAEGFTTPDDRMVIGYREARDGGGGRFVGWISRSGTVGPGVLRELRPDLAQGWHLLGAAVAGAREGFLIGRARDEDEGEEVENIELVVFEGEGEQAVFRWKTGSGQSRVQEPGAMLLSAGGPRQVMPGCVPLLACEVDFLVTTGAQGPLCRIDTRAENPVKWKLERVWEFRRGFIGPSVWSHYLSRFGLDDLKWENSVAPVDWEAYVEEGLKGVTKDYVEEYRAVLEEEMAAGMSREKEMLQRCQMVGGPFVVPRKAGADSSIFVAASEAEEAGDWSRYLSHTLVYEISAESGEPVSIGRLPRNVMGSAGRVREGGVDWRCEEGAMVRLGLSGAQEMSFGPGGPDCVGRVEWYREEAVREREVWLSAPAGNNPFAWTENGYVMAPDGGYVAQEGERIYRFPIQVHDGKGTVRELLLEVPLKTPLMAPDTNYRKSGQRYATRGGYLIALTALRTFGDRLYVTIGEEGGSRTLVFEGVLGEKVER